jgi:hypothetical protein
MGVSKAGKTRKAINAISEALRYIRRRMIERLNLQK